MDSLDNTVFVHPSSHVDDSASIGEGSKIWHFCHVMQGAYIGRRCTLGQNIFVASGVVIGNGVKIQNNVSVYEGVTLEDDVFCGPSVVLTNVRNPRSAVRRRDQYEKTLVRAGASLGANSTILCGVTIGRFSFVGAGAVVTKNVPDHALVVGVPARRVGWMCSCGVKLREDGGSWICLECGEAYVIAGTALELVRPGRTSLKQDTL